MPAEKPVPGYRALLRCMPSVTADAQRLTRVSWLHKAVDGIWSLLYHLCPDTSAWPLSCLIAAIDHVHVQVLVSSPPG